MPYAPTLTPYLDENPCPRVEVFFSSFHPDTETVTVYRSAGGREYEVRGSVNVATAGSHSRIDYECPFGVAVTYRAKMFDAAGLSLGFTDPASLTSVQFVSDVTWLHNPLNPEGAVKVVAAVSGSAAVLSRPVVGAISRPLGRRVGVVLSQGRSGLRGLVWDIHAYDLATADKVQALIGDYSRDLTPVVCMRLGGDETRIRVPKPLFLGVLDIAEEMQDVQYGGEWTIQRMTGDEVAPPAPGLFIPLLTNADLNAYYATNTALISDNGTNAAVNRRYDLAGFAG